MKKCNKCNEIKDYTNFNKSKKYEFQPWCKDCQKQAHKKYYSKNKNKFVSYKNTRLKDLQQKFLDFLKGKSCLICGETDTVVFELDHRNPKEKIADISKMIKDTCSWETIQKEINKCDIYCANCHRRKTAKDFNWYRCIKV